MITAKTIDRVTRELDELEDQSLQQVQATFESTFQRHPALFAVILGETSESDPGLAEEAVYLLTVICRSFDRQYGTDFGSPAAEQIEQFLDQMEEQAASPEAPGQLDLMTLATDLVTSQPELLHYLLASFVAEDQDPEDLDDEEVWVLNLLTSSVRLLEQARSARPKARADGRKLKLVPKSGKPRRSKPKP